MVFGIPLIDAILNSVDTVLDKIFPDQDERLRVKAEIEKQLLINDRATIEQLLTAQRDAIIAEIQHQSWLTANWRAVLMLGLSLSVVSNYAIMPYVQAAFGVSVIVELPEWLFILLCIGVSGYLITPETLQILLGKIGAKKPPPAP